MLQPPDFLAGGGRVGALMRAHDWSTSPLGAPDTWPQALCTVVDLLLQSRFPMFVAWGPELGFLYNDAYAEILGAKHPAALGTRFKDIWLEIWPDISPLIDAAMRGQSTFREDLPLLMNRKGYDEQTWFTFSYSPVRDETGTVAGMFCAVSETTDKVLAERALRQSEGRLRALVAASSYALFRMSPDWSEMLVLGGQGFVRDPTSPSGDWLGEYIHPDDQARVTAEIRTCVAEKRTFELEHRVRRVDGTIGWTLSRAVPLLGPDGTIVEWFGAASDITARRNAEEALRELNETLERRVAEALAERKIFADIVEGTDAFVQVIDGEYRWLAINEAATREFERLFGVRPKTGDNVLDVLQSRPEQRSAVQDLWQRALAGEGYTVIADGLGTRGEGRAHEMRLNPLRDREGHVIGAYQFAYDVTERLRDQERLRTAEAALRQAQKMESLGQLTGGVAHDFNNLLAVFAGGLQIVERSGGRPPSPRVIEAMRRAVIRGTGLTRHLLAFSRRAPVNAESIDVAAHLASMRPLLEGALGGNIDVCMTMAPDAWLVEVDAGEMELAILNLCVNARDAMPEGGTVTVDVQNVSVPDDDGTVREHVRIDVADTGLGMTPEVQARAFEPFFTTKDVSKGSGLGLPQVYGFVQQSGGRVTIESSVGLGTIVTMLLPRSPRASVRVADDHAVAGRRAAGQRRGHVLLVEDDADVAALSRELLSELGFAVTHVPHPDAARALLAAPHAIDIVLSDIMMPGGMSGLELAREIRRVDPALPIVLSTGYAEAAAGIDDGEFALLLKPYTLEALAEALRVEVP